MLLLLIDAKYSFSQPLFITAKASFHHCPFSFITAHFTLKHTLLDQRKITIGVFLDLSNSLVGLSTPCSNCCRGCRNTSRPFWQPSRCNVTLESHVSIAIG